LIIRLVVTVGAGGRPGRCPECRRSCAAPHCVAGRCNCRWMPACVSYAACC